MSDPIDHDQLVTLEVRLYRVIDEDGRMAVKMLFPETFNAVEVLGLLEAAKWHVYKGMRDE